MTCILKYFYFKPHFSLQSLWFFMNLNGDVRTLSSRCTDRNTGIPDFLFTTRITEPWDIIFYSLVKMIIETQFHEKMDSGNEVFFGVF